jgi:hypothetical protein
MSDKLRITVEIKGTEVNWDLHNFPGDSCETEIEALRVILGGMGVKSDVIHEEKEKEKEPENVSQRQKLGA